MIKSIFLYKELLIKRSISFIKCDDIFPMQIYFTKKKMQKQAPNYYSDMAETIVMDQKENQTGPMDFPQ